MFRAITNEDIESELLRRGLYTEVVTPTVTPIVPHVPTPIFTPFPTPIIETPVETPTIPEAPATPIIVYPGVPTPVREPVMPYIPQVPMPVLTPGATPVEVTDHELWLPGAPPTREGERRLSKSALVVGGLILAAVVLFTHEKGKPGAGKKPALRRRVTTEVFRRPRTEVS